MRSCLPFILILFLLPACDEAPAPAVSPEPDSITDSTGELQGTWRSLDDDRATVRFEGNLMISASAGQADVAENYVIDATCADAPDDAPKEDGKYLIIPDAGRCYYIIRLTEGELEMSYVGRGDTLRYAKVIEGADD